MNIEITDWIKVHEWFDLADKALAIRYTSDSCEKEMTALFTGDDLYNALVEVGVFESYSNGYFYYTSISPFLSVLGGQGEVVTSIPTDLMWRDFNHLVDTRIMKQLVELKMKGQ